MTIAYLANSFPEAVEPYVWEEICELRRCGQEVLPCSIKRPQRAVNSQAAQETLYVVPLRIVQTLRAIWLCARNLAILKEFVFRAVAEPEPLLKRLRALMHTWIGAYLAVLLHQHEIEHIHVHHGYFASWAGMVAAKLLGTSFSLTLHGSDLLVRADYLDLKLSKSSFCITISEFNRQYILVQYPEINPCKILVHRIGIDISRWRPAESSAHNVEPLILSVGRLHAVKSHAFLIRACHRLKNSGMAFCCAIAGEGRQRHKLEQLIRDLDLQREVTLLGQIPREQLRGLYSRADVVVLTSASEGIPATLMEAMAMEKLVLAPAITGIPELITDGETGFLYRPGSMDEFVEKLQLLTHPGAPFDRLRRAARTKIKRDFNSGSNLRAFANDFVVRLNTGPVQDRVSVAKINENSLLQQI